MNLSRVAVKLLTPSDLSFFAQHLKRSKQKGINLNSDVFVDLFYPSLKDRFDELHFPLTVIGPGAARPDILSRKALRPPGGKNWRLDGEMIHDPADEPGRYDRLAEGDLALMAFEGSERPEALTLVLITKADDSALHSAICETAGFQGRQSMVVLTQERLCDLLEQTRAQYRDTHPLETILLPDSIEEAVFGSAATQDKTIRGDGRGAAVTQEGLKRQLKASEEMGRLGEEAFERWLAATGHGGDDFEWVSRSHARAAFDFLVQTPRWPGAASQGVYVEVKATKGARASPIHMSMAELRWAAAHASYRIARVYELGTTTPRVAVLAGIHELASTVVRAVLPPLPSGVSIDAFEIEIEQLSEDFDLPIDPTGT